MAAGRWVVMATDAAGQRNRALQLDPASGEWRELWVTSPLGNVTDWSPAPDGRSVAYRIIQRSSPTDAIEALVVRDLAPGAPARVLTVVDASKERLAGFGWAPDGSSLGFGLQALAPEGSGKGAGWSLRSVTTAGGGKPSEDVSNPADAPEAQILWQAEAPPDQPLALVLAAYDPERGRAVVSQLAADSGIIASLRLIDLLERRESTTLSVTIAGLAPVAGVGTLALPEGAPLADRLLLLDLASGESRERLRWPPGGSLGRPLWSADGRLLAIAGYTDDADGGETAILVLDPAATDAAPDRRWFVPGGGGAPLAFSPDSRWLLTQAGAADEAFGSRLMLLPLAGGDPLVAPLTVPPGSWALSWLP
ncbi:MAG TPA: hypothetical protein PLZ56_03980 [Anaerolineae bacterium]|nr:hypothetical protein [Anaerolineae bacterium]